jgi:hypothetical protein
MAKQRKQKKRAPRKPKGGAPLPKSVQALLKYLSLSGTGIGGAGIGGGPTAVQQFQAADPRAAAAAQSGQVVVKKPRAKKTTKTAATASPLQGIVPQAAGQTTIIQVPAVAPKDEEEKTKAEKEFKALQATSKQQAAEIENLKLGQTQQGAGALNAQFFQDVQRQIQEREQSGLPAMSLRTSQAPSYMGMTPSFAGRSSMRGSESGGEAVYETAGSRASSVTLAQQSAADIMEQESSGLGEHLAGQYIQSVSNPVIPSQKMGRGRPSKSEEEKKATRAAAAQRRKEAKQLQQEQTRSQSLAQLSGLGAAARSSASSGSSTVSAKSISSNRAQQIYSQAQQAGADPSSTIRAMAAGGGAAAVQQIGGGYSLGELSQKKKVKLVLKNKEK